MTPCTVHLSWGRLDICEAEFEYNYDLEDGPQENRFFFKNMNEAMRIETQRHRESTIPRLEEIGLDDHEHPILRVSWSPESHTTIEMYAKMMVAGERREMSEQEWKELGLAEEHIPLSWTRLIESMNFRR